MSRKSPAPPVGTVDDLEAEFYDALQQGDVERLMATWADEDDIVCVHPGGPRVVGPAAIRTSFAAMFAKGGAIAAVPEQVRRVETLSTAVHSVLERIALPHAEGGPREAFVVATNVYLRGPRGWRLVAHHASPGIALEVSVADRPPSTLH